MKFHVGNRRYFFKLGVFGFIFLMVTPPNPIHSHQSSLSLTPIPTPTLPIPVSPFIPPSPFEIVTTELLKQYNQEQCCYINIKFFFHRKWEARELDKCSLKSLSFKKFRIGKGNCSSKLFGLSCMQWKINSNLEKQFIFKIMILG